jgi:hypothetical protein
MFEGVGMSTFHRHRSNDDTALPQVTVPAPVVTVDGWTLEDDHLATRLPRSEMRELATLLHYVNIHVETPWTYERAGELLEQAGDPGAALAVYQEWLAMPVARRPALSAQTRTLERRRQRLRDAYARQRPQPGGRALA